MNNAVRNFSLGIEEKLGQYVYALRDPRDNKIFYVGKGIGNRVFAHFKEADAAKLTNQWTSKLRRIVEIWEDGLDVQWWLVRHNLQTGSNEPVNVFDVEAALIDILEISQNGPALNDIGGHRNATRGMLSEETVESLAVTAVNPPQPYPTVFVFPIQTALAAGNSAYDATRRWWGVTTPNRNTPAIAVGLERGLSKGVFDISQWELDPASGKSQFTGTDVTVSHPFAHTNWATILGAAMGFFQRGNFLIVEFDGNGNFRIKRGSSNKAWLPL